MSTVQSAMDTTTSIQPFQVNIPEAELEDLRRRIAATQWPRVSRLYWEYKGGFFNAKGVSIPVALTVFPGEQYQAPRSWAEEAYPNLIYFNEADKGGHFAAWEQPQPFSQEIRAAFRHC
jgi:hypothetical protein